MIDIKPIPEDTELITLIKNSDGKSIRLKDFMLFVEKSLDILNPFSDIVELKRQDNNYNINNKSIIIVYINRYYKTLNHYTTSYLRFLTNDFNEFKQEETKHKISICGIIIGKVI